MSHSKLLIVFLFFSFFILFASSSYLNTTLTTTTSHQCSALLLFKQNFSSFNFSIDHLYPDYSPCKNWLGSEGYYPIMMNWNTSIDCCDWDGVTCDHSTGNVIGLDLSCGMLQGTLHPNTSLFKLPYLQRLNLAFNDFTGFKFPHEVGRFSHTLTHLNMSECGFSGQVPAEITLLHKLVSLDLSRNFDFSLEPRVFIDLLRNYTNLEELSLGYVYISLVLPASLNISSSSSLKLLTLGSSGLQGKLPQNIFELQSLEILDLYDNRLTGQIPWEISLLPKLVSLDLSSNGNLRIRPYIFSSFLKNSSLLRDLWLSDVNIGLVLPTYLNISSSSLKTLYLDGTGLEGKLPDNIFNLQYLEEIDLSGNTNLIGPLPRVNATIPLKRLDLKTTNLSGEIPNSIGHFKSLTYLDLSNCSLTGPLPKSIVNLRHLTYLELSSNKLNGALPFSVLSLPSLKYLYLDENQFDGQIDVLNDQGSILKTFRQLTNLTHLDLSYNNFSGDLELDTWLFTLANLIYLDLSYNGLSVATSSANHHVNPNLSFLNLASCKIKVFPESLRSMRNLERLDLSSNEIHGQIPHWAGEIGGSKLTYLNLSHNLITGLPQFQWYGLDELYLQSNMIQGPFPPSICNLSNLMYLDLSNNRFGGVIPQCIGNIITSLLKLIDLGTNHFQGTIPNVYNCCGMLEGIVLNRNELEGGVPSSLSKCQSLKIIDLGNNHLNGTFPHWLGSLPNLQVLVLKSNNFRGPIVPFSTTVGFPFQSLQVFDLSYNGFLGQLPKKYFQNFNAIKSDIKSSTKLEYLNTGGIYYSINVSMKGGEQDFPQIFVGYKIVCLSHNQFDGEIPDNIGNLNLLIALDLSHNSLTGQIPHAFGKLSRIESLDLSWNQLTGKIPQSLADLTSLGFLNLSQNHLAGLIPAGKQFNTFEGNSFEGNSNLCGFPLPKNCNENPQEPQLEGDGDGDEEESGFTWNVVMMGYGCGTGLGLVMGYLMLSTRRLKWFNAVVDAGEHMILKRRKKRLYILYIGK